MWRGCRSCAARASRRAAAIERRNRFASSGQSSLPGALRSEVQRKPEAEEAVSRADRLQVARAGVEHGRVGIEQRQPREREQRGGQRRSPRSAGPRCCADPRGAQRPFALAGADVGARPWRRADRQGRRRAAPAGIRAARRCRSRRSPPARSEPTRPVPIAMVRLVWRVTSAATRPTRRMSAKSGQRNADGFQREPHDARPRQRYAARHERADA